MPRSRTPPPAPSHNISAPLHALQRALAAQDRAAESYRRGVLPAAPTYVASGPLSLLISGDPAAALPAYRATLASYGATRVVRLVAPASYPASELPLEVTELPIADGVPPPLTAIDTFLELLDEQFGLRDAPHTDAFSPPAPTAPGLRASTCIAVHCDGGIGRAPVFVAVALIELGWDAFDAVAALRARRRGAINGAQAAFLHAYVPRRDRRPPGAGHRRSRSSSLLGSLLTKKGSGTKMGGGKARTGTKEQSLTTAPPFGRMSSTPVRRVSSVLN